jgi:hypothetical protein
MNEKPIHSATLTPTKQQQPPSEKKSKKTTTDGKKGMFDTLKKRMGRRVSLTWLACECMSNFIIQFASTVALIENRSLLIATTTALCFGLFQDVHANPLFTIAFYMLRKEDRFQKLGLEHKIKITDKCNTSYLFVIVACQALSTFLATVLVVIFQGSFLRRKEYPSNTLISTTFTFTMVFMMVATAFLFTNKTFWQSRPAWMGVAWFVFLAILESSVVAYINPFAWLCATLFSVNHGDVYAWTLFLSTTIASVVSIVFVIYLNKKLSL